MTRLAESRLYSESLQAITRRRLSDCSAGWGCGERVPARRIPCEDSR